MIYGLSCYAPVTKIKLPRPGRLTRVTLVGGGGQTTLQHNGLMILGYACDKQDTFSCDLSLDPGDLIVTSTKNAHVGIFIATDESPTLTTPTIEYHGLSLRYVQGGEWKLVGNKFKELGPSAVERAQGINPRKTPSSVGLSYTDDELDAFLVDAQRP